MGNDYKRMLVVGITYNKVERGVYALILQELGGTRRLPIVIGMAEAQSIECKLQDIITPRPLTHDLMVNIMRAFGVDLQYVVIKQLNGGIFTADLYLTDGEREVIIDSRSSDGISLALRMGVPIYASEELLAKIGLEQKGTSERTGARKGAADTNTKENLQQEETALWRKVKELPIEQLQAMLDEMVEAEQYEKAARLRDIINNRNKTNE
ncbi:MAG: bifunctional nuclease family protein [Muribaculaceae bacterium]|nr:bifunctional nuclease family protein [Muribaculaceae bacterium]